MKRLLPALSALAPTNPILWRVVQNAGKRKRDLVIRCGYLGALVLFVILALAGGSQSLRGGPGLAELSLTSQRIFMQLSYLQLALVALLAPIFTAGAITQQRDSQTYDILLATPLSNGQIVLGSLLSRLFLVIVLLLSGVPVFSITQIFGGVSVSSIGMSFAIAAATALLTGALAVGIATFQVGTRRTIFGFYFLIVLFLVGGLLLDRADFSRITLAGGAKSTTGWFTAINPFLALRTVFGESSYTPPAASTLPPALQGSLARWYVCHPAGFFVIGSAIVSLLLVTPSIIFLRRITQTGVSPVRRLLRVFRYKSDGRRRPRPVWTNPIAWREARTRGSNARATLFHWGFCALGVSAAVAVVALHSRIKPPGQWISKAGYNASAGTLFVSGPNTTYGLSASTRFLFRASAGEQPMAVEASSVLPGTYALESISTRLAGGKTEIVSAVLAPIPRVLPDTRARQFLLGLVLLEVIAILLLVTNVAASTVTREKEDGSLDLLLSTPITSRYYLWGKLRGLVMMVIPLLSVPVLTCAISAFTSLLTTNPGGPATRWIVLPESVLILPPLLLVSIAFAAVMGMHMSLRLRTTVQAVMISAGVLLGFFLGLTWMGYTVLQIRSEVGIALATLSPLTIVTLLVDPWTLGGRAYPAADPAVARAIVAIGALLTTVILGLMVWAMYASMVRNFDMVIRRQSR